MIDAEANDLTVHVQMCRMRHAQINARLSRIERVGWAVFLAVLGTSAPQIMPVLVGAAQAFAGR